MSSSLVAWDLQTAIWQRLSTDQTLLQMTKGIYDGSAAPNSPYPYVVVGEMAEVNDDHMSRLGKLGNITLHVWTDYEGFKPAKLIAARVNTLIERRQFTLNGWALNYIRFLDSQYLMDLEEIRHAVLRYEFKVQPRSS